ncbi:T9SS type A sorting domain-containing protein [Candidatus Sulfidibacterium hydrothermale]|uniref:T9SS type A sorting domain-containing protein n=1 Tax=Candidatus Sulfidibacterium hydrothermale TaxID=2875962 RepID=UPI001F0A15B7|nr:T9SS type A sorting domain-containing protein [Candidatus Sulfidibacterium hydrothermale]UBM62227.1 T9SS type A sorting domain-containing protein [Candidatus Sulfidibacterium hydrothermale]
MKKLFHFLTPGFLTVFILSLSLSVMGQTPFIKVVQPNGGESWAVGTTHVISWNDNFTKPVKILLSTDNGVSYQTIANSVEGTTWSWKISKNQATSDECKIKVVSTVNDQYADESNHTFSITAVPAKSKIRVLQPNVKHIEWAIGTAHKISWESNLGDKKVNIDLISHNADNTTYVSDGSGYHVLNIKNNVEGTTYDWKIPSNLATGDYYIQVSSVDDPSEVFDMSNNTFAVTEMPKGSFIKVLQPNVKHIEWAVGTTHKISWNSNLGDKRVNIDLISHNADNTTYVSDGSGYHVLNIKNNVEGTTYDWKIPSNLATGDYYIQVSSVDDPSEVFDMSNNTFAVTEMPKGSFIKVLQPNVKHIEWAVGTTHKISWNSNLGDKRVNIDLISHNADNTTYVSDGSGYHVLNIKNNVEGTTYDWKIPSNLATGDYYIQVSSVDDPSEVFDMSNNTFAVTEMPKGSFIKVLQPNVKHIEWAVGTTHKISWNSNLGDKRVNIDLISHNADNTTYVSDGSGYHVLNIKNNVEGTTYDWKIPSNLATGDYYIQVSSVDDPSEVFDMSNNTFEVTALPKGSFIKVIQPNVKNIEWAVGTTHKISWDSNLGDKRVNIDLISHNADNTTYVSDGSGYHVLNIKNNVEGTTYDWKIPSNLATGDYYIQVSSVDDPSEVFDMSNNTFEVTALPKGSFIKVIQPSVKNIEWAVGTTHKISWDSNLGDKRVNIDLISHNADNTTYVSDGSGYHVLNIKNNVEGTTYDWEIPSNLATGDYYIQVSSVDDPSEVFDMSNNTFAITQAAPKIDVYPNPATTTVTLKFNEKDNENYVLTLYNRFNMRVMSKVVNTTYMKEVRINTFDLPNGIYFLRLSSPHGVISKKIIVQHD